MKIIFDFDHTIYDMTAMHEAIYDAMEGLGITREMYKDAYEMETHWKMFTVNGLSQHIEKLSDIKANDVERQLNDVAKSSELFVYEDVDEHCKLLKDKGHDLILLSWGDAGWQKNKIDHSGVEKHFDEIVTAMDVKTKYLTGFCETTCDEETGRCNVVVIDDKPAELLAINESNPLFHLIRIRRANGKYSDQPTPDGMHEAVNMRQVMEIIDHISK